MKKTMNNGRYSIKLTHIATDYPKNVIISKDDYHSIVWPIGDSADITLTNVLGIGWDNDFFYGGCVLNNSYSK